MVVEGQYTVTQLIGALAAVYGAGAPRAMTVYTDSQLLFHAACYMDCNVTALPLGDVDGPTVLIGPGSDAAFDFCYDPGTSELVTEATVPAATRAKRGYRKRVGSSCY